MGGIKNTFTKFFTNKTTVTILGVVLGLGVLVGFYIYRVNKEVNPTRVPVAKREILATEEITKDDIEYVKVRKKFFKKADVYQTTTDLIGKYVATGTSIPKGGMFYTSQVVEKKELPNAIFDEIPEGYTIYQLKVNETTTYANSIYPGDRIDLWLKTTQDGMLVFGEFISNIEVLAVRDKSGQNVFDVTSGRQPAWLLFAVKTDMYRYLKLAENIPGMNIIPVPKNNLVNPDIGSTEYSSQELIDLIESKTISSKQGKDVFYKCLEDKKSPKQVVKDEGMMQITKLLLNRNTVTILGVLAGVIALWFAYSITLDKAVKPTRVPVAVKDIPAGSIITKDDIEYVDINRDVLKKASIITSSSQLINYYVNNNTSVTKGSMFYTSQVVKKDELIDRDLEIIPENYKIYWLSVDNTTTYANSIYPGDKIDLWLLTKVENNYVYEPFITNIEVLSVKDSKGQNVFDVNSGRTPAVLAFAVPNDIFVYLSKVGFLSGMSLYPVPINKNNADKDATTEISNKELQTLIDSKSIITNPDNTENNE